MYFTCKEINNGPKHIRKSFAKAVMELKKPIGHINPIEYHIISISFVEGMRVSKGFIEGLTRLSSFYCETL